MGFSGMCTEVIPSAMLCLLKGLSQHSSLVLRFLFRIRISLQIHTVYMKKQDLLMYFGSPIDAMPDR